MPKLITNDEYLKKLSVKFPNVRVIKGEYKNSKTILTFKCDIDGREWTKKAWEMTNKDLKIGCPECRTREGQGNIIPNEEFIKRMEGINSDIEILSEYKGSHIKVRCKCKIDGYEWDALATNLLSGTGCQKCKGRKLSESKSLTNEEFLERLKITNKNIEPIDKYTSAKVKMRFHCKICNHIWSCTPYPLLHNSGCPSCKKISIGLKNRKKLPDFISDLKDANPTVLYVDGFNGMHKKATFKSKMCEHTWKTDPANVVFNKTGCPYCSMSHGERSVFDFLYSNNINFISQKTYSDLLSKNKVKLSYDFYLPKYNLLIEFQGEQHERPIEYFGGETQFEIQQEHDKRKRDYAKLHNIELLEIWYYDVDNIEQILQEKLNINSKRESA